jgi:Ca2+-binding EF-hand superfamily protein
MPRIALTAALLLAAASAVSADEMLDNQFFSRWDLNGDGAVTVDEARQHRITVFDMFDQDGDNYLDADEYAIFDDVRDANREAFGAEFGTITKDGSFGISLRFNDRDGNGVVSIGEFMSRAGEWIQLMDRNTDGIITADDFRISTN